jgi:hypothetical protein
MTRELRAGAWSLLVLALASLGCAPRQARALRGASHELSRAVARNDADEVRAHVVPGARGRVDAAAMLNGTARRSWAKALDEPEEVRPEAIVFLGPEQPVGVEWTEEGWRFSEDPTDVYAHRTPRQALRALVRATRAAALAGTTAISPRPVGRRSPCGVDRWRAGGRASRGT